MLLLNKEQIYKKKGASKWKPPLFYLILLIFFWQFATQSQVSYWSSEEQ